MPIHQSVVDPDYWTSLPALQRLLDRPTNNGSRLKYLPSDPDDFDAPGALILEMPPGYELPRHAHECDRLEIVISGSLDVGDRVLHAGDVMSARAGETYGPHKAGPEGAVTAEFFTVFSASWRTIYDTPRGPIQVDALAGGTRPPDAYTWTTWPGRAAAVAEASENGSTH